MNKPLNILIAPDSMKESLDALSVADAIAKGLVSTGLNLKICKKPMADGGEGTVDALINAMEGRYREIKVHDPLMRPIKAKYGILENEKTAVIEVASASGLALLTKEERNPLETSSYGTGELILDALNQGYRSFIMGLGGSATNDGGVGLMKALGLKIYDQNGQLIPDGGGYLLNASRIDDSNLDPRLNESTFIVACDVQNPLTGANGASHIFAPQKGATPEMVGRLEQGMKRYSELLHSLKSQEVSILPGAGAAGGIAASLFVFCNAVMQSGFELIAEKCRLEEEIKNSDLIITAEGRTDSQTLQGKVPYGILTMANRHGIPVIIMAGTVGEGSEELYRHGVKAIIPIVDKPMSLNEAMQNAENLLIKTGERIARMMKLFTHTNLL